MTHVAVVVTDVFFLRACHLAENARVAAAVEVEREIYRVGHLVVQLGWVDLDLGCSTILLGQ